MTFPYKRTLSAVWVCVPLAAGLATQINSPAGWVTLTLIALVPPAIMTYLWREPVPSTSERIQDVLR